MALSVLVTFACVDSFALDEVTFVVTAEGMGLDTVDWSHVERAVLAGHLACTIVVVVVLLHNETFDDYSWLMAYVGFVGPWASTVN